MQLGQFIKSNPKTILTLLGIGISFGSACASGTVKASEMLVEMGLTNEDALSTVRISFGKIHQLEDVQKVAKSISEILKSNVKEIAHYAG